MMIGHKFFDKITTNANIFRQTMRESAVTDKNDKKNNKKKFFIIRSLTPHL